MVIHTRAAEEDTFAILAERAAELTVILHCFSAPDTARRGCRARLPLLVRRQRDLPEGRGAPGCRPRVPPDLLMVETDSPYLSPQPVRGKPNQPANVIHTARFLAELRDVSYDELDRAVHENSRRVFGW